MMDRLKHIPLPIWIGLALVLIVIFLVNSKSTSSSSSQPVTATAGPVTNATVGTAGAQSGAGTDQQLGNLSQVTQGGFSEILQNQQNMQNEIAQLQSGDRTNLQQWATVPNASPHVIMFMQPDGVGTGMTQFGSGIQNAQNNSAQGTAAFYANGTPVNNFQG